MRKDYYWIYTEFEGQPYLLFGGESEQEARAKGIENIGSNFTIKKLPTRDIGSASRMIKGNRLEQTKSMGEATKRLKHSGIRG